MRHFAVSAIGKDRPGIVGAVSEALLEHGGNIEDSQMTILRGHFTMMLIVSTPDEVDTDGLHTRLEETRGQLGLEAVSLREVTEIDPGAQPVPSHIVSVYGADHPGIVHAVSAVLAERQASITDLNTRLVTGRGDEPLYAMMLEVALPEGLGAGEIEEPLQAVAQQQGIELTVRPLEQDAL